MLVETLVLGPLGTNCYLVSDGPGSDVIIIDPAARPERIREALGERNVAAVLLTHGHFDHTGALSAFADKPIYIHSLDAPMLSDPHLSVAEMVHDRGVRPPATHTVQGGDVLTLAGLDIRVLHTPGHTRGSVCYMIDAFLFCGDTIFRESIGRTDLPTGDMAQMSASVKRIAALPGNYKLFPGHGEASTLSHERMNNPYLFFSL